VHTGGLVTGKGDEMSQEEAIKIAEEYLRSCTPNAKRSNRKLIGLQNAVDAANQVTGRFAEAIKGRDPEGFAELEALAEKLFNAFEEGNLEYVLYNYARDWA